MKQKLGFLLGVLAFYLILFTPPNKGMRLSTFKVVLKHSKDEVSKELGASHKDINSNNLYPLLEESKGIPVKIPQDFSKTGTKGVNLSEKGKSLYDAVEIQVRGLKNTLALA